MASRKIEVIDKTILDNFYKLVHEQPTIRLRAATSTFKILDAFQKRNNPKFNENLNYCIERLVSGLSSSRAQARRGYGILLLEILKHHQITTDRLLTIASQKFGPIHKDTSKDELLGHFLLATLILESGNISKSKANNLLTEKIYRSLINLHKVKSYFDLPICETLQKNIDIFYPYMLSDIPKGVFETETKVTPLELMIIGLCNVKKPIKEFISMDNSKINQVISVLRIHNLKRLPLHPLLIIMSETFITYFAGHFENFYKEVINGQTDIMKELMIKAPQKILVSYIDVLVDMFVKKSNDRDRGTLSQLLAYAIRRPQMIEQTATILKVVKICMINSMFKSKTNNDRNHDPVVQAYHTSLECLISICNPSQRVEMLNSLLDTVKIDYFKKEGHKELWTKFYSSWVAQRDSLMTDNQHKHLSCIASLYMFYGLQVIEHEMDCQKQLEELKESANDVMKGDPADGSWADILTDQIIAILSATECDLWIRSLADKVFGTLLPHISQTSIDLLCDALAPYQSGDSEEESGCDSEEDDDDESDDDMEDSLGSEANENVSDQSSEVNENQDCDPTVESNQVNMDLDEDSNEEYLDDDQMMKYDKVLAEMFKLRRLDKKKDNVQIGFKLRLLDLVKRILKRKNKDQETVSLLLSAIIPLAKSSRSTKEGLPIYVKVKGILSKMPSKGKYPEVAKFLEK